jgi:hypothetical protein
MAEGNLSSHDLFELSSDQTVITIQVEKSGHNESGSYDNHRNNRENDADLFPPR